MSTPRQELNSTFLPRKYSDYPTSGKKWAKSKEILLLILFRVMFGTVTAAGDSALKLSMF